MALIVNVHNYAGTRDTLSVASFAEYHGITDAQAAALISLARDIFNTDHPEA